MNSKTEMNSWCQEAPDAQPDALHLIIWSHYHLLSKSTDGLLFPRTLSHWPLMIPFPTEAPLLPGIWPDEEALFITGLRPLPWSQVKPTHQLPERNIFGVFLVSSYRSCWKEHVLLESCLLSVLSLRLTFPACSALSSGHHGVSSEGRALTRKAQEIGHRSQFRDHEGTVKAEC